MDAIRKRILREIEARGLDLKKVSEALGRNPAYMQQYLHRNIPQHLKERDRARLAEILDIDETELGAARSSSSANGTAFKVVPEYDVRVSAGAGALAVAEARKADWPFNKEYLRDYLGLSGNNLAIVEVRGDSMEPTLSSGDRVMVDMGDVQVSQPGIFVIYDGGGTVIKRVEKIPGQNRIVLISDNQLHSRYEVDDTDLQVIGRVIWAARRL